MLVISIKKKGEIFFLPTREEEKEEKSLLLPHNLHSNREEEIAGEFS